LGISMAKIVGAFEAALAQLVEDDPGGVTVE
jgi:hypothetical protein